MNSVIIRRTARSRLAGTCFYGNKWLASCGVGRDVRLGKYDTELEAHLVYVEFKELAVKLLAEKYRDTIDPRAFEALMKWEVPGKAVSENKNFGEVVDIRSKQKPIAENDSEVRYAA